MRFARSGRSSKKILNHSVAQATFEQMESRRLLSGTVDVWSGAGGDGLYTDATNWVGGVAPTAGQAVQFPASATSTNVVINGVESLGTTEIDASYNISASNGGSINLAGSLTTTVGDVNISAPIVLGGTEVFEANDQALMNITGGISDGGNAFGIIKQGNGEVELAGTADTYTGETTGGGGILIDTTPLASPIGSHVGTTIYGSSSATEIDGYDGIFSPATFNVSTNTAAPATLTLTNGIDYAVPSSAGSINFLIGGPTNSSQIDATGGSVNLDDVSFSSTVVSGYTPTTGDVITLIHNQTGQPITGTFNGLAQGATVAVGGKDYTISYTGGSGHDVTLTAEGAVAGPVITSSTTSTSTHGRTASLNVVATDSGKGGTAGLTYTWTATTLPKGGKQPTYSHNGNNAASSVSARFYKAGTYTLLVTVKDESGRTTTATATVVVGQKATAITVTPTTAKVAPKHHKQYTATVLDQFGHTFNTAQAITWLVPSGGAKINSAGLFTAGSKKEKVSVEAKDGTLTAIVSASVT